MEEKLSIKHNLRDEPKGQVVDFYNQLASNYESNASDRGVNETLQLEVAPIADLEPKSVVEFGIGTGRFARALILALPPGVIYVGIDISQEMLGQAFDLATRVELKEMDFDSYISDTPDHFDVCVAPYTVFCHVEIANQLNLLRRIQEKCAHIFINVPTLKYQQAVWGDQDTVDFPVPQSTLTIKVFRIHKDLRTAAEKVIFLDGQREMLYFRGTQK